MQNRILGPMDNWFLKLLQETCLSYQINIETLWINHNANEELRFDLGFLGSYSGDFNTKDGIATAVIAHRVYYAPEKMLIPKIMLFSDIKEKVANENLPVFMSADSHPYGALRDKKWTTLVQLSNEDYTKPYGEIDETFMGLLWETISYPHHSSLDISYYDDDNESKLLHLDLSVYGAYKGKYNVKDGIAVASINDKVYFAPENIFLPKLKILSDMEPDSDMPVYLSKDTFPSEELEGNKWAILLQISDNIIEMEKGNLPKKDSE